MTTHTDKESFVAQNPGPSRPEDSIAIHSYANQAQIQSCFGWTQPLPLLCIFSSHVTHLKNKLLELMSLSWKSHVPECSVRKMWSTSYCRVPICPQCLKITSWKP